MTRKRSRTIRKVNRCRRCGGMLLLVYADLLSPGEAGEDVMWWHCVNCGEYVDRMVLLNRWAQQGSPPLPLQLGTGRSMPRRSPPVSIHHQRAVA